MNKKWVWSTFFCTSSIITAIMIFNYVIDPFQFYKIHQNNSLYWSEQRWQLAGLAKNHHYDTIVLGTSMTENFIPSEINDTFAQSETMKLSISGSTSYEQRKMAEVAFHHNKVDRVIWGIDFTSLSYDKDYAKEQFPTFLYDQHIWNDYQYLFNLTTIKYSLYTLLYKEGKPNLATTFSTLSRLEDKPKQDGLNFLYYWGDHYTYGEEIVLEDYRNTLWSDKEKYDEFIEDLSFEKLKENIDHNIIPVIKENPDTTFYLFYPPYSILMNKRFYDMDPRIIDSIIKSREYMFTELMNVPHVELYDYSHVSEIVLNLDHYKDISHYSPEINQFILRTLGTKEYLVTKENLVQNSRSFKKQIQDFTLENP
ncbi:hypothetical protein [Bacillus weihaiensis]|uniref:Uncharacterized protein n=1 Tax=Bacillus weihaiensis TaxID=1547283 RepID=A0A1L3MML3_9BACI|nr:hypothetical protein [Bacillus weihaiensis]APH03494.1 hypothetical protein A9C19_01270 [Bacillus weihaiensis]